MKIDLELKTSTDKEVVSSLRKIVALPIDYGQRVELAKRLILDSITVEGIDLDVKKRVTVKPEALAERRLFLEQSNKPSRFLDSHLISKINNNSRDEEYSSYTKAKQVGAFDYNNGKPHSTQDQIAIAKCLLDPHWFAWGMQDRGKRILLLCWQARFGDKPRFKGNMRILTDWSLEVPPVPLI